MDYQTAIERACKHAYENSDDVTRSHNYGGTYMKHLTCARFFEIVANEDLDISDKNIGTIMVDILTGTQAVKEALEDA